MSAFLLRAADWWLGTAIGGGLVLLVGCLLMRLARQPAARQRLGEYAVLAALLVAGLRLLPSWLPSILPSPGFAGEGPEVRVLENPPSPPAPLPQSRERGEIFVVADADPVIDEVPTAAPATWSWHDATAGLMTVYLLVAAILAGRWLLGQWALNRLLRQAGPVAPRVARLFTAMAAGAIWPLPRLRLSRRLRAPVCFGLRRPAVLLPEPMDSAGDAQLRWVFAHELTHLRRRDPWSSWGLGLAQAVYFFLPWFWWIRRSVRLCQEYVADAAAAKAGAAADEYAEFLVSLARGSAPPLGATGLGSSSDLLRRVQMLLQSSTRVQGSWPRGRSLLAAGGLLAVAVFAGGVGLRAEAPDNEKKPEEQKNVIVRVQSDGPAQKYIQRLITLPGDVVIGTDGKAANPEEKQVRVILKLADDGEEKKADKEDKPAEKKTEKKTIRMTVVIDAGNGPITIPLDANTADIGKEIEKAMKKAHEQADAAQKQRSHAIEKAMAALKGELSDEQIKQLEQHLKAMKAQRDQVQMERDKAVKAHAAAAKLADEARRVQNAADVEDKVLRGLKVQAEQGDAAKNPFMGHDAIFTLSPGGSRLGVQVKPPSADLADQLDLPKGQGLVIVEVTKGSAAAKAGFKANDILLELAGKPVSSNPGSLAHVVHELKSNAEVAVVVLRKGHKESMSITVPEPKKDGPFMLWQDGGGKGGLELHGNIDFTPELKLDGMGNVKWHVVDPTAPKSDNTENLRKIEKKEAHQNRSISINVQNDRFTAEMKEGDVTIHAAGKIDGEKMTMNEVRIDSPDSKGVYKKVADVPAKYRDMVKQLLANQNTSPVRARSVIIEKKEER